MARSQSFLAGGGVGAGVPFTLGHLTQIVQVDPPLIGDSYAVQTVFSGKSAITFDPEAPIGGTPVFNTILGRSAQTAPTQINAQNIIVGDNNVLTSGVSQTGATIIGHNCTIRAGGVVAIGAINQTSVLATGGVFIGVVNSASFLGVAIGTAMSVAGEGVAIGASNTSNNAACVAVGNGTRWNADGQVVIGGAAQGQVGHSNAIAIGRNSLTRAANSLTVGALNVGITDVLIGEGAAAFAGATDVNYRNTAPTGANLPGCDEIHHASIGTGNAATKGSFIWRTGTPGVAGSTPQVLSDRLAVVLGTTNGAAVDFRNTSTGAGVAVGTLNNAPSAGDPSYWLPVLIAGAVRYIPCWT